MGFEAARSCIQIVALKRPSARFGCLVDLAQIEEMKFKFYANTKRTHTYTHLASCADNVLSIAFGHFIFFFLFCFALCNLPRSTFCISVTKRQKRTKSQKVVYAFPYTLHELAKMHLDG